jgi:hypothetical protein
MTKVEKAKAYGVFIKKPENWESFLELTMGIKNLS